MLRLILVLVMLLGTVGCGARVLAPPSVMPQVQVRLDTVADKRAAFARAYDLFRHGEDEQALRIFSALTERYPELADYALYFAGAITMRRGSEAAAEAAFSRLLRDYPQSVKAPASALEVGRLLLLAGRVDQAQPLLRSALAAPDATTVQGAHLALAEANERMGNVDGAYAGYMDVRRKMVGSALGRAAKQQVLVLRAQHPEREPVGSDLLDEAQLLLAEHDYGSALSAAERLLQSPDDVEPAAVLRVQADALYGRGEVDAALAQLQALADRFPWSLAARGALFRLASVLWNRDQDSAALSAFQDFQHRYPNDHRAAETLYAIGRIHQSAERNKLALDSFAALVMRYPRSKLAGEARWRIGWIHYLSRDWRAAVSAFARLADETLSSPQRNGAMYWEARALEHAGRTGAARELYQDIVERDPTDYYAMWAERRLGTSSGSLLAAQVESVLTRSSHAGPAEDPAALEPAPSVEAFHFNRWSELKAAGVYMLARQELKAVEHGRSDDLGTMRYLLRAYEAVDGFAAAQRLLQRLGDSAGLSAFERQQLLYPLAFWSIVDREARDNSVDPLLIEALMRQESLFDPEARSPANAYGLMQLLPKTATQVASADGRAVDPLALLEPDVNIELGTRYLNGLLARFRGDVLKAVAAYNGGEAAVEKWERRFADLEPDEFAESISYRETRDYVKRVMTNYRKYRQLYVGHAS
ncbi:MAG: transglycosylase SLT domain-containing protein [Candidatus Binatia bacterium]